jgi:hypothetical protein
LRVEGRLRLHLAASMPISISGHLTLSFERVAGPDGLGSMKESSFASALMTATGLPIERQPSQSVNDPITQVGSPFVLTSSPFGQPETVINLSFRIPSVFPEGWYRPRVEFGLRDAPLEFPAPRPMLSVFRDVLWSDRMFLPIIRVGRPAPGRLYFTLLSNTLSNGSRGARAIEDRGRFGLSPRVNTPTTVASAAPDPGPNKAIAVATALGLGPETGRNGLRQTSPGRRDGGSGGTRLARERRGSAENTASCEVTDEERL